MMRFMKFAAPIVCSVLFALNAGMSPAFAKPTVALKLVGMISEKTADGKTAMVPVESVQPKPGDAIHYTVTFQSN